MGAILAAWSCAGPAVAWPAIAVRAIRPRLEDPEELARARERILEGGPEAARMRKWCDERLARPGTPGAPPQRRLAWETGAADLARCGLLFREADPQAGEAYSTEALVYMRALVKDASTLGDGKGGLAAVQRDSGFFIRLRGVALPTAYDRLAGLPLLSPEVKRELAEEMVRWVDWYEGKLGGKGGYEARGEPWQNYYSGYFLAKGLIGLAIFGDHPRGAEFVEDARRQFLEKVRARLDGMIGGGYPPEGWAYGTGLVHRYVQFLRAWRFATGEDLARDFAFLRNAVRALLHTTKPDGRSVYDGGMWGGNDSGRPVPVHLMRALGSLLGDLPEGRLARAYVQAVEPGPGQAGQPAAPAEPLAYLARGTNLALMRSSWAPDAVWAAFQSGGPHLGNAQVREQGHLTIWYKGRDLLINAGMWREGPRPGFPGINNYADESSWRNTILIEDRAKPRPPYVLSYPPGQGYSGRRVTRMFEDGGAYVFVSADITEAYAPPDHIQSAGAKSAVERVTRDLVYLRPRHFIVVDRVRTVDESYHRRLVFHFANGAEPVLRDRLAESRSGEAKLVLQTVWPERAAVERHRTPSTRCARNPACPSFTWRVEVRPEGDGQDHTFLHVLAAVDAATPAAEVAAQAIPVEAGRAVGALVPGLGGPTAVLVDPEGKAAGGAALVYRLPHARPGPHLLFGMVPGGQYRVASAPAGEGLRITVTPDPAGAYVATPAGVLAFRAGG